MVAQVGRHEGVDTGGPRLAQQAVAGAAADGHPAHAAVGVATGPHPDGGHRQGRRDPLDELAQRHRRGQLPDPAEPEPAGEGGELEDVEGRFLVGVHRPQRAHDRGPGRARQHHLDACFGHLLDPPDGPPLRVRAGQGQEGAHPGGGPRAALVRPQPAGAGPGERVDEPFGVLGGHERDDLVQVGRQRPQRPGDAHPDGGRQRVRDARVGDVGVRVRGEERDAGAHEAVDARTLGVAGRHAVHPAQEQRVVGDHQVGAPAERLVHDGVGGVDREQHPADRRHRVTDHETDGVPRLGGARVVQLVHGGEDLTEARHRAPSALARWTRTGSNRRPPRCKRGALTS